jgi:hypothetical protein
MGWFGTLTSAKPLPLMLCPANLPISAADDDSHQARSYDEFQNLDHTNEEHRAKMSHELIAGAASFEAMKAYEDHVARNGTHPQLPPLFPAIILDCTIIHENGC